MNPPDIAPVPVNGNPRPFWSVMIPAYNPSKDYLEQMLRSVLVQDPGPEQMQIEVVDDCSPDVDVAAMMREIAGDRVKVSQTHKNLGLAGCWNTCIERARGEWVHILHQDDLVLPGFYNRLASVAELHPEAGLLATRTFFVDEAGQITGVTARLRQLENGGRMVDDFYYSTPIQCSGVTVRRNVYERQGGFILELKFVLDCEMWSRVIGSAGGVVMPDVLSCYRNSAGNETSRLNRTAESLHDLERLNQIFVSRFENFSIKKAQERICEMALGLALRFSLKGDVVASKKYSDYWRKRATAKLWFRRITHKIERILFK